MNTHEFQGKSLLRAYNVDIQEGFVATTADQAIMIANQLRRNTIPIFRGEGTDSCRRSWKRRRSKTSPIGRGGR